MLYPRGGQASLHTGTFDRHANPNTLEAGDGPTMCSTTCSSFRSPTSAPFLLAVVHLPTCTRELHMHWQSRLVRPTSFLFQPWAKPRTPPHLEGAITFALQMSDPPKKGGSLVVGIVSGPPNINPTPVGLYGKFRRSAVSIAVHEISDRQGKG